MPHTDALVVITTVASEDEAVRLVRALLDRRIIACGTLMPGSRSLYKWQGKTADEREVVILLKTRSGCLDALKTAFGELHPYKVPELLALTVEGGTEKYLEWINGETTLALAGGIPRRADHPMSRTTARRGAAIVVLGLWIVGLGAVARREL